MEMNKSTLGPYLRTGRSTRGIMVDVTIALIPALLGAVYFFGIRSLYMTAVAVAVCVLSEYLWQKTTGRQITAGDFSAVVTGILIAFNMPVTTPFWVIIVSSLFSTLVVKQMFGGIGNNFVNPALMGRLLVMILWPASIMQYAAPKTLSVDAVSSATVLSSAKMGQEAGYTYWQMFIGEIPGAIGETSKLLLLIGFLYMCYKGIVNCTITFSYIITVALLTWLMGPDGFATGDLLGNLFGGGLILGACFMLTDYTFATRGGRIFFGFSAGLITALIRIYSNYPEGVCFGILLANCLAGILGLVYKPHIYGVKKT